MLISTRGRYALRVLVDMAEHQDGNYIPLKDISDRQEISKKYMESIMVMLSKAGLVTGVHGKGGGYVLSRKPEDYTIDEILEITEGSLAPVACLECDAQPCPRVENCRTVRMWTELDSRIHSYLKGITLADLMSTGPADSLGF